MLNRIICLLNLSLIFTALSGLYSQYSTPDNHKEILNQEAEDLKSFSEYIYGKDVRLVNGRIYSQPHPKANSNPFMKSPVWIQGSVKINGKNFSGLKLNYDIWQDNLIYLDESPDGDKNMLLLNIDHVEGFNIENNSFVTLGPADANNLDKKQYFEVLCTGKVSLFNRWTKTFEAITTQEFPAGRFLDAKISRYLLKDKILYKVNNRIALLKQCDDRKPDLKKYIRKNKIDVRRGKDERLAGLIEYYNSLIAD